MQTLCTLIDPYKYSQLTVHEDYKVLAKRLGYEHKYYTIEQFASGQIDIDHSVDLFIFECALLKVSHRTTMDVKHWFPNCKMVALSTDGITYKHGYVFPDSLNPTKEFEIYNGYDVDLWLDTHREIADDYSKKGILADTWKMTSSHYLIEQFADRARLPKTQDIICLIASMNPYRRDMIKFLESKYRCQWGTDGGTANYDLDHLYQSFSSSHIVLGTTSPGWWSNRSQKGFRDWIGPICGTVLIYDDHPDVLEQYTTCPIYLYDDFNSIVGLIDRLKNDPKEYETILGAQLAWIKENTIAIQLYNKLMQHKIV